MELGFTFGEVEDSKYKIENFRYAVFFTICRNVFSSQDGIFELKCPLLSEGTHMKIIRLFLFRFSSILTRDEKCLITVHCYHMRIILWSEVD